MLSISGLFALARSNDLRSFKMENGSDLPEALVTKMFFFMVTNSIKRKKFYKVLV
jgi:hypothetical protein